MTISVEPFMELLGRQFPDARVHSIEAMAGGMSSRRFFRARLVANATRNVAPDSVVGVYTPDAQKSEEVSRDEVTPRDWPFLEVHRLLTDAGVRVPTIFGVARDVGWMALEDLGDLTLARALLDHPEQRTALYQLAVKDLARAHAALSVLPEESIVSARQFDRTLLLWEIEHFREYALIARGIVPSPTQARRFTELAERLANYVAELPTGFVHRDYQSRNLMWLPAPATAATSFASFPPGELVWIDFQDALVGPRVYDLVALLNDSYQSFTRDFVEARLQEYAEYRALPGLDPERVRAEFDAVTVQRKLKDAGRFVYFHVKNGDASYLEFVSPTIGKIKSSLQRLAGHELFEEWSKLLNELLPSEGEP
jgi:aminoglycoside/choline kinase family phosphotransferase